MRREQKMFACFFHFTCPLAPRWRIGPPHVHSIDSCLVLQCTPHSRTATLLWTSLFPLCATKLFLAGLSFSFPLRAKVTAVTQSLSGCCLRMCPRFSRISFLSSTVFLGALLASSAPGFPSGFHSGASCCVPLGPQDR